MRIVIDIDGTEARAVQGAESTPAAHLEAVERVLTDGGAAPNADAVSGASDSDGGGPSQDLLDAIRAVEQRSGKGATPGDGTDAGAAPTV